MSPLAADLLRHLWLPLAGAVSALLFALWILARWLGVRLGIVVPVVALLLPIGLLWPWMTSERLLAPTDLLARQLPGIEAEVTVPHEELNDALYQFLPWEAEVRHSLAEHRLPFWSDLIDGGSDLWANPQAQVLSPVANLARALPLQHHLLACLVLKMVVGFVGAWVLCRRLGARPLPALLGSSAFTIGGGIVAWALFTHSTAAAWSPWLAASLVSLGRRPTRLGIVLVAVTAALVLLAGHPEVALGAVAFGVCVGLSARSRRRARLPKYLASAAVGGLMGFGFAAPHLLPFVDAASRSLRAHERLAHTVADRLGPKETEPSYWRGLFHGHGYKLWRGPLSAYAFGIPYFGEFRGPWSWPLACSSYAGLVALAGTVLALFGGRRKAITWALAIFWALALLLSSRLIPLERLLFLFPPLRVPEFSRFLPIGSLALAICAALGWNLSRASRWSPIVVALALVPAVATQPGGRTFLLAALVTGASIVRPRSTRACVALAFVALALDQLPWARYQLPSGRPAYFFPWTRSITLVAAQAKGGRAVGEEHHVYPGILSMYGVSDPRPHNPLAPSRQIEVLSKAFGFAPGSERYFSPFSNVEHPLLDFLGVRIVVSNLFQPAKSRLTPVANPLPTSLVTYLANPAALPVWFLPTSIRGVDAPRLLAELAKLQSGSSVVLQSEDARGLVAPRGDSSTTSEIRVTAHRRGYYRLEVPGSGNRLAASSLPLWPGWRAKGHDASRLPVITVNGAYLGVVVRAGYSTVDLQYRPSGLVPGGILGVLSLLLSCALVLVNGRTGDLHRTPNVEEGSWRCDALA